MHRRPRLTLAIFLGAFVMAAASLLYATAAWSFRSDPNPTRDLIAELNAPWSRVPESARAAPVFQSLHDAWRTLPPPEHPEAYFELFRLKPSDPTFPIFAAAVASLEPHLARAREASKLPDLGANFVRPDPSDPDSFPPFDAVMAESAIQIRIPGMVAAATAARLLLIDADAAAIVSDTSRAAADLHAALAIARQLCELPIFIADYLAISTVGSVAERIRRTLAEQPDLFSEQVIASLQSDLTETSSKIGLRINNERFMIADLLDRTFASGPGGRITAVGLRRLESISSAGIGRQQIPDESAAVAPLLALAIGTRAEHLAALDEFLDAAQAAQQGGPAAIARFLSDEAEMIYANRTVEQRLPVVWMMTPALGSGLHREAITRLEVAATTVAIALHRHRLAHGHYPESLDQLLPEYLSELPLDPFDLAGGSIKYRLSAAGPTLYFNGANLRDDGGKPLVPDPNRPNAEKQFSGIAARQAFPEAPDADWVIFPDPSGDPPAPTDADG